jgi:tripartite-type tricarboxylate transporter receptor subunit TctC
MRSICATAALAGMLSVPAAAQSYPAKPVRIIVPFAPGGSVDLIARLLVQRMSERLNAPVVVENRAGGGTNIGAEFVARAAPDGYTVLMASTTIAVNVSLYPKLAYGLFKDFAPVSLVAVNPSIMLVHPSLPVKSVQELIALAKRRPGALTYASSGSGSSSHLAVELLRSIAGIDIVHVPFKGAGPALTALLGGHVELLITITAAASPYVKSGKLRALAVTSAHRVASLPDVPTAQEAGLKGYEVSVWAGLLAPAGTSREIVARLNGETHAALEDLAGRFAEMEAIPAPTTPERFGAYLREDAARWAAVVKRSGARIE